MKTAMSFFIGIFFFVIQGHSKNNPTVYSQLCTLNKEWLNNYIDSPILNETDSLNSDHDLIQLHLRLVEKTLRSKSVLHLSSEQKEKRNACLDILHTYWQRGIFPVNLYHQERTPYFIDHLGTACAVGHMVIETGYGDFAKQIQDENNYGYICDLDNQYPILRKWAFIHGFSLNELAWIQPTYGGCWSADTGYVNHPTCPGFNDGHIYLEIPVGGTPPYSISGPPCWMLGAGNYEYTITDANGNVYIQSYTVVDPLPIAATANWVSDATSSSSCDGIATASNSGGTAPFNYYWFDGTGSPYGNSQTMSVLCPGECYVIINDVNGCQEVSPTIIIDNLASVEEDETGFSYSIFPNPTNEVITIVLTETNENSFIELTDLSGRIILHIEAGKNNKISLLDLGLERGCYFVRIENNGSSEVQKIVFVK